MDKATGEEKLGQLLDKLLYPKFEIDQVQKFQKIVQFFENNIKQDEIISYYEIIKRWLDRAVAFWSNKTNTAELIVSEFTLNLLSVLIKDERKFCDLNENLVSLVSIFKVRCNNTPVSLKLAYIKVLSGVINHNYGFKWFVANNLWQDALKICLDCESIVVKRDAIMLVAKSLDLACNYQFDYCDNVARKIMSMLDLTHEDVRMKSILLIIGNILEHFLVNSFFNNNDTRILRLFYKYFNIDQRIFELNESNANLFELEKIMLTMKLIDFYINFLELNASLNDINNFVKNVLNFFNIKVSDGTYEEVMKYCTFGTLYFRLIRDKFPIDLTSFNNDIEVISEKMVSIQNLPLVTIAVKYCEETLKRMENDKVRANLVEGIKGRLGFDNLRLLMKWKNELSDSPNLIEIASKSLIYCLKDRQLYLRNRIVLVTRGLIYNLQDLVIIFKDVQKFEIFVNYERFIGLHLDTLTIFIEEFHITWRDSVETIDLMDITFEFLMITRWPADLVVKALKLLNMCIKYYMTPNLALLVDEISGSKMAILGYLLDIKLQDCEWRTRGAALNVLITLANLSISKFPSLQKVLMDSDLPGLVVKMATADGESFVRATAIKCLQEMIQVEEIWNNSLKSQDLAGKMRHILVNETEGIVRVEAATFMCISYENNQFPEETLDKIYETMIHSSTSDLHWEVKVRALNFWDKVINNHLQHQGMIDGSFPNVTFSKEHRKIVTLTDAEIKKRLTKVLGQLSGIGCLGVLISAIRDDCDMEVSKTAVKITQKLLELLKKYNINADSSLPVSPQSTDNGMSSSASISSGVSADDFINSPLTPVNSDLNEEVINQIVNSRDSTLLQNVYAQSDYGSVINYDMQVRKIVSPNEFLLFTQQDLNVIINEKKNWLNGIEDLGSLLDDMLKSYDDDDVNSMDCY